MEDCIDLVKDLLEYSKAGLKVKDTYKGSDNTEPGVAFEKDCHGHGYMVHIQINSGLCHHIHSSEFTSYQKFADCILGIVHDWKFLIKLDK